MFFLFKKRTPNQRDITINEIANCFDVVEERLKSFRGSHPYLRFSYEEEDANSFNIIQKHRKESEEDAFCIHVKNKSIGVYVVQVYKRKLIRNFQFESTSKITTMLHILHLMVGDYNGGGVMTNLGITLIEDPANRVTCEIKDQEESIKYLEMRYQEMLSQKEYWRSSKPDSKWPIHFKKIFIAPTLRLFRKDDLIKKSKKSVWNQMT